MKSVRIWFEKRGLAIYTSHLDMNRCLTRAVRRANIPLWYTEGFNPPESLNPPRNITCLLPLPLGQEGRREPLDIRIEDDEMPFAEIVDRLNAVMPEGIRMLEACEPVCKSNQIAAAEYEITAEFASEGEAEGFAAGAAAVMASGVLNAEKRSKKGIKTVNLCGMTRSFDCRVEGCTVHTSAVLAAGSSINLNAELLMNALFAEFAAKPERNEISRLRLLLEDLTEFK
ncbi:radical SAM-linked protein [Clostridium sp. CAG:413]|nr:radical SAM-linked protein [Clostridium sp. CAG:413]